MNFRCPHRLSNASWHSRLSLLSSSVFLLCRSMWMSCRSHTQQPHLSAAFRRYRGKRDVYPGPRRSRSRSRSCHPAVSNPSEPILPSLSEPFRNHPSTTGTSHSLTAGPYHCEPCLCMTHPAYPFQDCQSMLFRCMTSRNPPFLDCRTVPVQSEPCQVKTSLTYP